MRRLAKPKLGGVFPELAAYDPLGVVRGADPPIDFDPGPKLYLPLLAT